VKKDRSYMKLVEPPAATPAPAPADQVAAAVAPPPVRTLADPPADYDDEHRAVWAEIIAQQPGLQPQDRWALSTLVSAICLHRIASKKVREYGSVIKSPNNYPIQSPYVSDMNKQAELIRKLSNELGLTYAARTRGKTASNRGSRKRGTFDDLKTLSLD
jgi:P27 family predicted phage terminase small subunit